MYAFRHALVGEAIHGDLLPGEDTALHARIAAAIDAHPELLGDVTEQTVAAELACHWRNSHELGQARSARACAPASRPSGSYAYEVAQRQFERALELWPRVPDAEERAGHGPRRGAPATPRRARARRGEASRAVALLREALAGLDRGRRPGRAPPRSTSGSGNFLRASGTSSESFDAFDRAVALLPPEPSAERARVLETRARVEMLLGEYTQALRDRHAGDRGGARGRRRGDRGARAQHARLHARRARRRGRRASRRCARRYARADASPRPATAAARRSTCPRRSTSPASTEEALALVRAEIEEPRDAPRALQLRRLPAPAGGRTCCIRLGPAGRGARAAAARACRARRSPTRRMFWRDDARAARAAHRRPRGAARGARGDGAAGRRQPRAAVDRAVRANARGARAARGPDRRRARRCCAARAARSSTPTRRTGCCGSPDGRARRGRGRRARAGARRALRARARRRRSRGCATRAPAARASTRRARGAGWRRPS